LPGQSPAAEPASDAEKKPAANGIAALPIGGRIKVDPWNDQLRMLKSKPVGTLAESEKMPFEVTPFVLYLMRQGEHTSTEAASAVAAAKRMAAQGKAPDFVFAVDTFVSADSPLESRRFADAILGQGFVVRAVDNSNIVPPNLVQKLVQLSHAGNIAVQYGVTGGGNDGAAFSSFGSTDVALGWPLRYSHSPGEVVDVRDLEALAKIIAAAARSW